MKYHIYAKILGTFLPEKITRINNCKIEKGYWLLDVPEDRPTLPPRMKSSEFHILGHGVRNFTVFPQRRISIRTFESDYYISTIVEGEDNLYFVLEEADKRFTDVTAALSLSIKNTVRKLGKKRVRRGDESYDYEIVAAFIKQNKRFIRIKLPEPLPSGHNYFPKPFPKGFISRAKKYLKASDHNSVFKKGLAYLENAYRMYQSGNLSELEIVLNLVKTIELVCHSSGIGKIKDRKSGKMRDPNTKELFELAGKKLGVLRKHIKYAQTAWDARSKADIAHYDSDLRKFAFLNYGMLDAAASDYLIKFHKAGLGYPSWYVG